LQDIPTLHMLSLSREEIEVRAKNLIQTLSQEARASGLIIAIEEGKSAVGGGSGPATHPATVLISFRHDSLSADEIQRRLRLPSPPVIARISDGKVLIDLRTVAPDEEAELLGAIRHLTGENLTSTP
jgi:L-seryl-tRNA(Ser) seleniumtransferase